MTKNLILLLLFVFSMTKCLCQELIENRNFKELSLFYSDSDSKSSYLKLINSLTVNKDYTNFKFHKNDYSKIVELSNKNQTIYYKQYNKSQPFFIDEKFLANNFEAPQPKPDRTIQENLTRENNFITSYFSDSSGISFTIPQPYNESGQLIFVNPKRPDLNIDKVIAKLNDIGLIQMESILVGNNRNYVEFDRLFINQDDPNFFLIIWQDSHKVYSNLLSNSGEWKYENPKIMHEEIKCILNDTKSLSRNLMDENIIRNTSVNELNIIKKGNNYFVAYIIDSYEATPCFKENISTLHFLKLDLSLNVEKSFQYPEVIKENFLGFFDKDSKISLSYNSNKFLIIIQNSFGEIGQLFYILFDENLSYTNSLIYLNSTVINKKIFPVISFEKGFILTYEMNLGPGIGLFSQYIRNDGMPSKPSNLYLGETSHSKEILDYIVDKDDFGNINFYISRIDINSDDLKIENYRISIDSLLVDFNYKLNDNNWMENKEIKDIYKIVEGLNNNNNLIYFSNVQANYTTKNSWVDSNLIIRKYSQILNQKNTQLISLECYYDEYSKIRYANFTKRRYVMSQVYEEIIQVFFDLNGNQKYMLKKENQAKHEVLNYSLVYNYLFNIKFKEPYNAFHNKGWYNYDHN